MAQAEVRKRYMQENATKPAWADNTEKQQEFWDATLERQAFLLLLECSSPTVSLRFVLHV